MKRKRFLIKIVILIIIIVFIMVLINMFILKKENNEKNNNSDYNEINNEIKEQNNTYIEEIKTQNGYAAENNLYQVDTEYDGRKVLNIKSDIQYKVAFAGIINQENIKISDVDEIFDKNYPVQNGIWVEETSRKNFVKLLQECTESTYKINNNGYLVLDDKIKQNENDKILEKIINSNKKIIITINNSYKEIDNVTGEIVEYPFEKLDNYQSFDSIISDNNFIIVISTNSNKKSTNMQIIEEVLSFLKEILIK